MYSLIKYIVQMAELWFNIKLASKTVVISFPLRSAAEIASKWRFYLFFFSFLGITSELFDEFAHWFLNYQPSFYHRTAIPLSILFHSILFPYISFQILFLWILFLMWAIYTYHCLYHFSLNVLLYVCFMYHYFVPCIYMYLYVYVFLFIYLFIESRGLATWWC